MVLYFLPLFLALISRDGLSDAVRFALFVKNWQRRTSLTMENATLLECGQNMHVPKSKCRYSVGRYVMALGLTLSW